MTTQDRRDTVEEREELAVDVALSMLEAEADMWASEVDLNAMIENVASVMNLRPDATAEAREHFRGRMKSGIDAITRQAFIEGAYRAYRYHRSPAPSAEVRERVQPTMTDYEKEMAERGFARSDNLLLETGSLCIHINKNEHTPFQHPGTGYIGAYDDELYWDQDSSGAKPWRYLKLTNDDLLAIRDKLNERFPTKQATVLLDACDAAESILRYMPYISTNCNGTKPNMDTSTALAKVRNALNMHNGVHAAADALLSTGLIPSDQGARGGGEEAGVRTPGYIEACSGCGVPRFYENGNKGSDGGCDGGWTEYADGKQASYPCPIRAAGASASTNTASPATTESGPLNMAEADRVLGFDATPEQHVGQERAGAVETEAAGLAPVEQDANREVIKGAVGAETEGWPPEAEQNAALMELLAKEPPWMSERERRLVEAARKSNAMLALLVTKVAEWAKGVGHPNNMTNDYLAHRCGVALQESTEALSAYPIHAGEGTTP